MSRKQGRKKTRLKECIPGVLVIIGILLFLFFPQGEPETRVYKAKIPVGTRDRIYRGEVVEVKDNSSGKRMKVWLDEDKNAVFVERNGKVKRQFVDRIWFGGREY